jgi:formylglycine-generating enzyme required for sulfatase activity
LRPLRGGERAYVADRALKVAVEDGTGKPWGDSCEEWLDDGFAVHAPAGSFRPNAFGLHEVIGNVAELCLDVIVPYERRSGVGSGAREEPDLGPLVHQVVRGGSWAHLAQNTRSADRASLGEDIRFAFAGVRPARALEAKGPQPRGG